MALPLGLLKLEAKRDGIGSYAEHNRNGGGRDLRGEGRLGCSRCRYQGHFPVDHIGR